MFLKQRPPATIIIVCAFELLGIMLLPSAFFKESTKEIGMWYEIYLVTTGILSASAIWYLWRMKRVGLYIYFAMYTAHNIVAVVARNWLVGVLIIPLVGAALLLPYAKKMS
jgi:hypothetical protein